MEQHQYRITFNGTTGETISDYDTMIKKWDVVCNIVSERGGSGKLEGRTVYTASDIDMREMLTVTSGWIFLKNKTISPWSIYAEVED